MSKVIIVGGGVSGLSAGIFLKKNGYDVEIYEKNPYAGGFLTSWVRKGSIIDGCLHWMLGTKKGTKMNNIWRELGALDDSIEIIKTNSFYKVELDGETFTLYNDFDKCKAEFLKCSQNDDNEINKMFELISWLIETDNLELMSDVPYDLPEVSDNKSKVMDYFRHIMPYFVISLKDFAARFNSPIIKMALEYSLINNHFNAFYFLQTLANLFVGNDGLPKGGSHKMRDRIVNRYLSLGGKIFYNSDVSKIIVENNTAKGIVVKDKEVYADFVIAAGDMHYTLENLLGMDIKDTEYQKFDDSIKHPCYSFVIGCYRTKYNFSNEEVGIISKIDDFEFMGHKYNLMSVRHYGYDESLMNDGYTTVQVMLTTYDDEYDYLKSLSKEDYKNFKKQFGQFFKNQLEARFAGDFEEIDVFSPLTLERYNHSFKGTFMPYPLIERMGQVIRSFKSEVKNLFFANQWVLSPGGVGVASINGKMAAQLVLNSEGKDYRNI